MMFGDEETAGPVEGASGGSRPAVLAHPQNEGKTYRTPVFHPPAYRVVVAGWPEDWRERWGRRANDLEEAGLSWRDAEAQAFVEVWNKVREEQGADVLTPASTDPERN